MNLRETVKINEQIIALILKKADAVDVYSLPIPDRNYINKLKMDNKKARKWIK